MTAPPASPPVWHRFLSGTASGAALVLVGHPLDTLRVRLQLGTSSSLRAAIADTLRADGLLGLYRGCVPPILLTGFVNTVLWGSTYTITDLLAAQGFGSPTSRAVVATVPASFISSLIVTPMELLKTRQQTSGAARSSLPALVSSILRADGARGLYKGWTMVFSARVFGGWLYFGGNAFWLEQLAAAMPPGDSASARTRNTLIAGGLAGSGYWCAAMPFDTLKTKLMATGSTFAGPAQAARELYAELGVRGFYRGFAVAILRAIPANAAAFTAFDLTMRALAGTR